MTNASEKRMLHYDLLRILAAFSVVMLHSASQFWYTLPVTDSDWLIMNSYDSLVRFGVPVFVMISGALFLSDHNKTDIKRLYTHNILRLLIIYIVWSCLYGLFDCRTFDSSGAGTSAVLKEMLYGRYHLWYLPMLIGIYMLLPILRVWVNNAGKRNLQYFLLLFFLLKICRETALALFTTSEATYVLNIITPELACSYVGYFVLGYYLSEYGVDAKYHKLIYLSVIPAALCNSYLGNRLSLYKGKPLAAIYDSFSLFTFVIVVALFLFFESRVSKHSFGRKTGRVIREISADTLGVYVMHIGLQELLMPYGIHSMTIPVIVGVPLFSLFCFVSCVLLAAVLRRIPVIGRYLC